MKHWGYFLIIPLTFVLSCNLTEYMGEEPTPVVEPTDGERVQPTAKRVPSSSSDLRDVDYWLYLIDVNLSLETVDQIVASSHDMVVLDFISFEANNTDYPMAKVVDRLHNAPHPKRVLAYIDVGQAEDFRVYWQPGWGIGNPEWIVGGDPDGWAGNYPVAYWYEEWREFAAAIAADREPVGNGRDGLEALKLVQAIYQAAAESRVVKLK